MRILVLSQVDDWDLGPRLKAAGHDIVAWARPIWKRNKEYSPIHRAMRNVVKAILSQSKPIRMVPPKFDAWGWLEREKIPQLSCKSVNAPEFVESVRGLQLDLIVVCIFPQILKSPILEVPRLGVLNCHPSLLPQYGGPQPAFWMLKKGESTAGVTVHIMTEKIDAGNIVAQQSLAIGEQENVGQLLQRQHHVSAALLTEAVNAMSNGIIEGVPQNVAQRSYFGKKKAADTIVDWNESARNIANLLRALQPFEPLVVHMNGTAVSIYNAYAHQTGFPSGTVPGEIVAKRQGNLIVQTGDGTLEISTYEIAPFHGWVNRILRRMLLPVGGRFDQASMATREGPAPTNPTQTPTMVA